MIMPQGICCQKVTEWHKSFVFLVKGDVDIGRKLCPESAEADLFWEQSDNEALT
jgi:hypothetical protein